jgi:hypothetical protein
LTVCFKEDLFIYQNRPYCFNLLIYEQFFTIKLRYHLYQYFVDMV